MDSKTKIGKSLAIIVFAVVALVHLARLVFGWEVLVAGWAVPNGFSVVGVVGPAAIAWLLFRDR